MPNDTFLSCPCGARGCLSTIFHRNTHKHTNYELTQLDGPIVHCECGGEYRFNNEWSHKINVKHTRGSSVTCDCGGNYFANQKEDHLTSIKHRKHIKGNTTARQVWANAVIVCACGGHFTQANRAKHEKTGRHSEYATTSPISFLTVNIPSLGVTKTDEAETRL